MLNAVVISASHESHHSGGSTFGGAVERGAGWGLGRDLERTLFHLMPAWLVVLAALAGAAFLGYRWWTNTKAKRADRG